MDIIQKVATFFVNKADYKTIIQAYYKGKNSGKGINWKRQAKAMSAKEIKDWKMALMSATDPDTPRRGDLMRFYDNLLTDLHLCACIDNRILPVQCAPFKLVDDNDDEDEQAKKLLERPWYIELVKLICSHTFEGTKLLEMFELDENMELREVIEVPQSNFIPQKGIVLKQEYDQEGISYKEGPYKDYYVQIGGDWSLGMLNRVAIIVIAKKLGLGSWMSYIEKYGVPPIFAITNRMDTNRRDELFEMLENFRMNHFAVLQGDEKIETPQGYNVDAYNTFKSLMDDVANKEISKYILGGTGTTDEKSFVGAAEVHNQLLKLRNQVDKLIFKFYFNQEIKPRLVKLSPVYAPLEKLHFEYDESENLSVKEIIDAISKLSLHYEFDIEELERVTGLPFTALKNIMGSTPPPDTPTDTEKKKFQPGSLIRPAGNNFIQSSEQLIYARAWDASAERVAEQLFRGELKPADLDRDFVLKTYNALNKSAENGYGNGYYNDTAGRKLRENILQFSGAKTHRILSDMNAAKGAGLGEKEFKDHARKVTELQMNAWLITERRDVARSAQTAAEWQDFEHDRDIYPNLKNRTMLDDAVRDSHAINEGIVKPIDEWTEAPPYDHNCRCWLEQTTDPPTVVKQLANVNPSFSNNPGRSGQIYSKDHSYFDMSPKTAHTVRQNTEMMKRFTPYSLVVESGDQKVFISDFSDSADIDQNIEAAKLLAVGLGKNIYVRPHINAKGYKNPELGIGSAKEYADLKTYSDKSNTLHGFLKNSIESASRQGAKTVIIDITTVPTETEIITTLKRRLKGSLNNRNRNIREVVIIRNKKVVKISREQVETGKFNSLDGLSG